ncbi:MAG: hypothetical protein IT460_05040 [Planctomycetes bacterium]|nr:hypothetical protein [Planctomycetota bacterium]
MIVATILAGLLLCAVPAISWLLRVRRRRVLKQACRAAAQGDFDGTLLAVQALVPPGTEDVSEARASAVATPITAALSVYLGTPKLDLRRFLRYERARVELSRAVQGISDSSFPDLLELIVPDDSAPLIRVMRAAPWATDITPEELRSLVGGPRLRSQHGDGLVDSACDLCLRSLFHLGLRDFASAALWADTARDLATRHTQEGFRIVVERRIKEGFSEIAETRRRLGEYSAANSYFSAAGDEQAARECQAQEARRLEAAGNLEAAAGVWLAAGEQAKARSCWLELLLSALTRGDYEVAARALASVGAVPSRDHVRVERALSELLSRTGDVLIGAALTRRLLGERPASTVPLLDVITRDDLPTMRLVACAGRATPAPDDPTSAAYWQAVQLHAESVVCAAELREPLTRRSVELDAARSRDGYVARVKDDWKRSEDHPLELVFGLLSPIVQAGVSTASVGLDLARRGRLAGRARSAATRGDWAGSRDAWREILATVPTDTDALVGMAVCSARLEAPATAVAWARVAGSDSRAAMVAVAAYAQIGAHEVAAAIADAASEFPPPNAEASLISGAYAQLRGDTGRATAKYRQAIDRDPRMIAEVTVLGGRITEIRVAEMCRAFVDVLLTEARPTS